MKLSSAVVTVFLLVGMSTAMAVPYGGPRPAIQQYQQQPGPASIVHEGIGKLIAFLRQENRPNAAQVRVFLDREIAPYFDFGYMARWIAGPRYRSMDARQRAVLERRLKQRFLEALAKRLGNYDNQSVRFLGPRRGRGNEVKVGVGILKPGGYPAKMDFRFYRGDNGWKVFDVAANGSSALVHYRQQLNHSFRQRPSSQWGRRL